jgi:serine/threonine-protein kinase
MNDELLEQVAGAIGDGVPVNWDLIESHSEATDSAVIAELKMLSALRLATRTSDLPDRPEHEFWGHLRVLERVGRGAFGEVYRAWDTRLDREVALKLLPPDSDRGHSAGSSIVEEGRLLARVRHANVVTIHGAERLEGRTGLWMEFINGRTLEEQLRDGRKFTAKEVIGIGVELCRAVAAVHAAGLLHRDIKAQNVMVADDGRVVLMDFGTGRESDGPSESNVAGTPLYLSPEVLAGAAATAHGDVYSVGVLLYHLLTGGYPVPARDLADLRRAHAEKKRTSLRSVRADVPQRLARVIERAIDPEPSNRYSSAALLAAALAALERLRPAVAAVYATAATGALVAVGWVVWELGARDLIRLESSPAAVVGGALPGAAVPVIAVLPFRNLSSEPDSDYFADGLTSEVIRNLAVIDGLQVRSQTSSFFFKDKPRNVADVGKQLGVNLIVDADVLRVGNRLRINAQLVQVAGDVPLWSDKFERTVGDVFAIQDEISRAIVNKLRLTLGRGQRRYQTNVEAYELYLRARALLDHGGHDRAERAAALLDQVIAKDAAFAPAHAALAEAYASMSWQIESDSGTPTLSQSEGLLRMRPVAAKAIELDPLLAEAHAAMGLTYARELNWDAAQKSFERAIELNPSATHVHRRYSIILLSLGKSAEALQLLEAALRADPLSRNVRQSLAFAQIVAGRYDDAVANLRHAQASVSAPTVSLPLARALTFSGRLEEAEAAWRTREQRGWNHWATHAHVRSGRRAEAEAIAASDDHPYRQALAYAALGDKDRTFAALNVAVDVMPQRTALLLALPEMALLRGDTRLDALRTKLKLP